MRASLWRGGGAHLFVSFRQRIDTPGQFDDPRPVRAFVDHGHDHLFVQSRRNDWFVNADTSALERALTACLSGYDRRVAMGFSMGGYGALRLGAALGLSQVVLVSPQFSIAPEHVPFDRRYRRDAQGFDPDLGDLSQHGAPQIEGAVLFDPFRFPDLGNAALIQATFPRLHLCRLAGSGHPATQVLRRGGHFGKLQRMVRSGQVEPSKILRWHRKSRRDVPLYWRHLARQAERSGRGALAAFAQQAEARLDADQ